MMLLFATKSIAIAAGTLLLLRLMRGRSSSDRSLIAHLGLAALVAFPLGSLLLPSFDVATSYAPVFAEPEAASVTSVNWLLLAYAVPALVLMGFTIVALLRLLLLTARAHVVVDSHWLGTLAGAQRRMGFRNSIALLTSDELASPVSWALLRPMILLNPGAVAASGQAEAIIAHELAHVVRWDWAKLVLARVTVALFWFNPFAWLLAREAHQLREEAADDAVLAAGVDETDYAALLVGTARHEHNILMLGAHGIAPARNSLARRVQRLLERSLNRSTGGRRWTGTMALVATALVAPVAALQITGGAIASPTSDPFRAAISGQEPVLFDLRVPEAPAVPVSAQAQQTEAGPQTAAEEGKRKE